MSENEFLQIYQLMVAMVTISRQLQLRKDNYPSGRLAEITMLSSGACFARLNYNVVKNWVTYELCKGDEEKRQLTMEEANLLYHTATALCRVQGDNGSWVPLTRSDEGGVKKGLYKCDVSSFMRSLSFYADLPDGFMN